MQRQFDDSTQLPDEMLVNILKFTDDSSVIRCSQVSCSFYRSARDVDVWRKRIIEAGCDLQLFNKIKFAPIDYAKLYCCYAEVASQKPTSIAEFVTALIEKYLDKILNFSFIAVGNDALYKRDISVIDNIFKNRVGETINGVMLEVITKLIAIDDGQADLAYRNFVEKYKNVPVQSTSFGIH